MIKIDYNPAIPMIVFDGVVKKVCSKLDIFCKQGYCGKVEKIAIAKAMKLYKAMDATAKATFDAYAGDDWQKQPEVKMPKYVFCKDTAEVLEFFNANHQSQLKRALECKASEFRTFVNDVEKKFILLKKDRKLKKESRSQAYKVLYYIFVDNGYDTLKRKGKVEFYKATGLSVCPYCNSNEIDLYRKKGEDHVTGQLDHFHPKESYPYFALSKFNLVPSCARCNGEGGKHDRDYLHTDLQNPYGLTDNDGLFFRSTFKPIKGRFPKSEKLTDIVNVILDLSKNPKLAKNRSTFNWIVLYNKKQCKKIAVKVRGAAQSYISGAYKDQTRMMYDGTVMQSYIVTAAEEFYENVGSTLREDEYLSATYSKFRHDIFFDYCEQTKQNVVLP